MPYVDDGRERICPVCFAPVKLVKEGNDRWGWYEKWECTRPDAKVEDVHHNAAKRERGGSPGTFVLRRSDYERAYAKRRRVQQEQERRVAQLERLE